MTTEQKKKPTIALLQGDPAGIGPELLVRLLNAEGVLEAANVVVVGDPAIFRRGEQITGERVERIRFISEAEPIEFSQGPLLHSDMAFPGIAETPLAQVSAVGGRSSVQALHRSLELARADVVDGIVFMPFNKASMHLGGNEFTDELGYAKKFFGIRSDVSEFNVAHGMWNGRITSHVAMKDVPALLTQARVEQGIELADRTLRLAGYARPRIVVAAYNPHAGDGGLLGTEEVDVIAPAVEALQRRHLDVTGPLPADTLWLKVRDGHYDVVVTMYHDQGQIAIKLLGFDQGVSVLAGLPVPITTPAHGTAFDIAGQNRANLAPTHNAFSMAVEMAHRHLMAKGAQ